MVIAIRGKKGQLGRDPLVIAVCPKPTISALQALQAGAANEGQQKVALAWIIERACRTYEPSHCGERTHDTAFIEGQRFAGNQIIAMLNAKLGTLED